MCCASTTKIMYMFVLSFASYRDMPLITCLCGTEQHHTMFKSSSFLQVAARKFKTFRFIYLTGHQKLIVVISHIWCLPPFQCSCLCPKKCCPECCWNFLWRHALYKLLYVQENVRYWKLHNNGWLSALHYLKFYKRNSLFYINER